MSSKNGTLNFVLIGAKSTGKTIYLSTLWGKGHLRHRDSEDKKYLTSTWNYIKEHGLAKATAGKYKELNFTYMHDSFGRIEFSMDDYDGSFTETVSEEDENTKIQRNKLFDSVNESEGIFFFLPYEKTLERLEEFAQEIDAFINLAQFDSHNKSPIPASIVVTKWDDSSDYMSENEEEACLSYIKNNEHLNRAYTLIRKSFKQFKIIPLSSFENYNLLEPLNYSLEKTFEQWFNRANELKVNKEYNKLINYLTIRYFDTKFNKQYNFLTLYTEVQELYVSTIEEDLHQKETIEEREKYLDEVKEYYQTKKELLEPFYMALEKEKKTKKLKKARNIGITFVTLSSLVLGGISYKSKLDVDEAYNLILDKYKKEATSIDLKEDITLFLNKYPTESSFIYSFSDIPKKRKKIKEISTELIMKQKKELKEEENQIMKDTKLTADEKQKKLNILTLKADAVKKEELNQKSKLLEAETITTSWLKDAVDCSKNCTKESGLNRIEHLFSELKNNSKIIRNEEVEKQEKSLYEKWNMIKSEIEEVERKKIFEEEKSNILSTLEDSNSINEVIEIISNMTEEFFEDEAIKSKILNTLKEIKKDEFQTEKGKEHFKALELSGSKDNFSLYLTKNIVPFIELKEAYEKLLLSIKKVKTLNGFNSINFNSVNKFEFFEQNDIKNKLNNTMDEIYNDLYEDKPSDKFELEGRKNWLNRIDKLDNFRINGFDYSYTFNDSQISELNKIKDELERIKDIKQNGISKVLVSIIGAEDNSLHFVCGITSAGRSGEEVTIKGFSSDLTYENKYEKCENNRISFTDKIMLKADIKYDLHLVEENYLHDFEVSTIIDFSLEELYDISEGKKMNKFLDNNKLKLTFER